MNIMRESSTKNALIFLTTSCLVYVLKDVITPFLIALFIAYLINPLITFIQEKLKVKNRGIATTFGLSLALALLTSITLLSLPTINKEFRSAANLLNAYAHVIPPIPSGLEDQVNHFLHSEQAKEFINSSTISEALNKIIPIINSVFKQSIDLISGVFGLFLILLYLVFILQGYPKFNKTWVTWIPNKHREMANEISVDLNQGMRAYFRGQATIALIVGVLFCLGFSIIGLPLAILMGLLIGLLNLVPYLQILGIIPVFILCVLQSMETDTSVWVTIGSAAIVFVVIQLLQELLLIPRIMNKATGLHPAIILLSLSIWGSLLGITGLILALPMSTLLLSYYKKFASRPM